MRLKIATIALMLPLCGCASGSFSLNPDDVHLAVGIGTSAYSLACALDTTSKYCTPDNQKKAAAVEGAVNGAADALPPQQP